MRFEYAKCATKTRWYNNEIKRQRANDPIPQRLLFTERS